MSEALELALSPPFEDLGAEKFYSEDQPRVPAGSPEGGEFAGGTGGGEAWTAGLKEHGFYGKEPKVLAAAETLKPLADQVSFKGLTLGNPPTAGTADGERYKYFEKLNQAASRIGIKGDTEAARWSELIKDHGADKVALAVVASGHIVGLDPNEIRLALSSLATENQRAQYREMMTTPPNPGSSLPYDRIRLAYAIDNKLSAQQLMDQIGGARSYSSVAYIEMNKALREGREPDPSAVHALAAFDSLLKHAPEVEANGDIYRGVRLHRMKAGEFADTLRTPGATFTEKAFTSASSDHHVVESWIRGKVLEDDGDPSKLYFKLSWPYAGGGKNVTAFHALGMTEGEINYRPGQVFRVKSVTPEPAGPYSRNVYRVRLEHAHR